METRWKVPAGPVACGPGGRRSRSAKRNPSGNPRGFHARATGPEPGNHVEFLAVRCTGILDSWGCSPGITQHASTRLRRRGLSGVFLSDIVIRISKPPFSKREKCVRRRTQSRCLEWWLDVASRGYKMKTPLKQKGSDCSTADPKGTAGSDGK